MNNIHTKKTPKRKNIPKILKNQVWDKYNGRENGIAPCYCCQKMIDSKNFETGHIKSVSSGGKTCLNNLRPICSMCNKSMGKKHMHTFMKEYGYTIPLYDDYYDDVEPMDTSPD